MTEAILFVAGFLIVFLVSFEVYFGRRNLWQTQKLLDRVFQRFHRGQ